MLNANEFIARLGGEEFILLLSDYQADQISLRLNEIRKKVSEIPFSFEGKQNYVTISIGSIQANL